MPYPRKGYRPKRTRRVRRTGRKLKQFSDYGMKALSTAYGGRRAQTKRRSWIQGDMAMVNNYKGGNVFAQPVDGYLQRTQAKVTTGYKPKLTLRSLASEVHQRSEPIIYRFQGLKALDDNGYYFANVGQAQAPEFTMLPMYIYDLTAIQNYNTSGVVSGEPFKRAKWSSSTSNITWDTIVGINNDGTSTPTTIGIEKRPWASTLALPHEKSRLLWTDVKMNLWGAQAKPTAYTIQLIKITDDNLDPWNTPSNMVEHSGFWQSKIKNYVYNPIAYSGGGQYRRGIKVLKTFRREIQPTSTSEADTDPHVVTLKMFNKWYRNLSYKNGGKLLNGDIVNTILAPDYAQMFSSEECKEYTDTKSKIFLLIRAEAWNRQDYPTINNITSPSFDLVVRTCHEAQ